MTRVIAAALAALGLSGPALADNYAILIGASTYPNLEERFWLKGPANDVDLIQTYLTEAAPVPFDAGNITVLADGVEGAADPTLQAIRDAFADLAGRVGADDFVYLHFSGHGTQAPALDPDTEIDGLDELFLPVDIGPWSDTVGAVENGLVDDEIGQLIGALRAKGATVWAVFDACHSGTVTRGAPAGSEEVRLRKLSPAALGVPEDAMLDALTRARALPDPRARPDSPAAEALKDGEGGAFIAFYAAQTNETTPEKRLPAGVPERRSQGVFTYTLFETLAQNPGLTYRQLGQEILRKYTVGNLALATPMFEGALDSIVFSGEAGERIVQWPLREGEFGPIIRAGALQGVTEGEVLALLPTAAASVDEALGYAEATFVETFQAELTMVDHNGVAPPDSLPRGTFVRKVSDAVDFSLTVALPDAPGADLSAAFDILKQDAGARLRFVAAGDAADVQLARLPGSPRPGALWFLPGSGLLEAENIDQTPSVGTAGRSPAELAVALQDNLGRMSRAINLLRMGEQYSGTDLNIDLSLRTRTPVQRQLRDMDLTAVPVLVPDDQVHVLARNNEAFPVDANVLHIGSNYEINHFFRGRLQPGDTLKKGLFKITDEAFGRDRVIIILTPVDGQDDIEDLRFLEQAPVRAMRGAGTSGSSFAESLRDAGFGVVTRGAVALDDDSGPDPVILQYEIDTRPANG